MKLSLFSQLSWTNFLHFANKAQYLNKIDIIDLFNIIESQADVLRIVRNN